MQQNLFKLNEFEQATLETLVSIKLNPKDKSDEQIEDEIELLMNSQRLIDESIEFCIRQNKIRVELGLEIWQ